MTTTKLPTRVKGYRPWGNKGEPPGQYVDVMKFLEQEDTGGNGWFRATWLDGSVDEYPSMHTPGTEPGVGVDFYLNQRATELREKIKNEGPLTMTTMFTKKHYLTVGASIGKAIAKINKSVPPEQLDTALSGVSVIVAQLIEDLKEDNPRFKRDDFLKSLTVTAPPTTGDGGSGA
jgi:hypothetical protein